MANSLSKTASALAVAAAFSMTATSAAAAELPAISYAPAQVETGDAGEYNQYRSRRDRRYRRYRHRNRGIGTGDVIAGVVVLGALAAILGSSGNRDRNRDRDDRRERVRDRDDRRDSQPRYESSGIENAVEMCVDQVEYRDRTVANVDQANRDASGWHVTGALADGERWACTIGNDGEVSRVDYGANALSQGPAASSSGVQLSDADYARARATTSTPSDASYAYRDEPVDYSTDEPQPAYPGGPLPGEEGYDANWQAGEDLDNFGG